MTKGNKWQCIIIEPQLPLEQQKAAAIIDLFIGLVKRKSGSTDSHEPTHHKYATGEAKN